MYGSVRGAARNGGPYRDSLFVCCAVFSAGGHRGGASKSRPRFFAVRSCQDDSPNGAPRTADRRKASSSAFVCPR